MLGMVPTSTQGKHGEVARNNSIYRCRMDGIDRVNLTHLAVLLL